MAYGFGRHIITNFNISEQTTLEKKYQHAILSEKNCWYNKIFYASEITTMPNDDGEKLKINKNINTDSHSLNDIISV